MKIFKFILVLFITVSMTSCSDDAGEPTISLSNANIAGTYEINSFTKEENEVATGSNGASVNLSTTSTIGNIFKLTFVINSNGTYTAIGQYTIDFTITPNGGSQETDFDIIDIEASGSFEINTTNNKITFTPTTSTKDNFINGVFDVSTFNETTLSITQEIEEINSQLTSTINSSFRFIRQ